MTGREWSDLLEWTAAACFIAGTLFGVIICTLRDEGKLKGWWR